MVQKRAGKSPKRDRHLGPSDLVGFHSDARLALIGHATHRSLCLFAHGSRTISGGLLLAFKVVVIPIQGLPLHFSSGFGISEVSVSEFFSSSRPSLLGQPTDLE